jgi:hypothetical protein
MQEGETVVSKCSAYAVDSTEYKVRLPDPSMTHFDWTHYLPLPAC